MCEAISHRRCVKAFPTLMLGDAVGYLIAKGLLPKETYGLRPFYLAAKKLAQKNLVNNVGQLLDEWTKIKSFLPPDGITQKAFSEPIFSAIKELQIEIKTIK